VSASWEEVVDGSGHSYKALKSTQISAATLSPAFIPTNHGARGVGSVDWHGHDRSLTPKLELGMIAAFCLASDM
jgi:hypothetical protein